MDYYYYDQDDDYMHNDDGDDEAVDDYDFYQQLPPHLEQNPVSWAETYQTCVQPSMLQISSYILALFGCSLLCRISWACSQRINIRAAWLQHLSSMVCGFGALYFSTKFDFLIVLLLALLNYVLLLLLEYFKYKRVGAIVAVLSIGAHFVYELLWHKPDTWQRIRGIQMVMTMKIISLAFDLETRNDSEKQKSILPMPALVPYLGYVFCPANCVLGPWISFSTYLHSTRASRHHTLRWLMWSFINILAAVLFLCLSNCLVPLLCSDYTWKWLRTYRDALAVRCSHYFICFLSQATLAANGVEVKTHTQPHAVFGQVVTRPLAIELPRSLSALVRNWNLPMHDWLKMYIFRAAHKRLGSYLFAILCTYLVSALLHGMHLRIYLVLLSLGVFAYGENVLRAKLASIFDACITANPCRQLACPFKHCPRRGWRRRGAVTVRVVNVLFSLIAVLHLAYLGIMLNSTQDDDGDEETSFLSFISKWSQLDYLSHWIAAFTYVFYYLI